MFLDDDLEGYDKMVSGRRKTGRVSRLLAVTRNPVLVFDVARDGRLFLTLVEQKEREG